MRTLARALVVSGALLTGGAAPAAQVAAVPSPPAVWSEDDWAHSSGRWGVEMARFPGAELAHAVRQSLVNMEWRPVSVEAAPGGGVSVLLGSFDTVAEAEFLAREVRSRGLAEPRVIPYPAGAAASDIEVAGPLTKPFLPTPGSGPKPLSFEEVLQNLRGAAVDIAPESRSDYDNALGELERAAKDDRRGVAAARLVRILAASRRQPEEALHLAGRVARGEWQAPVEDQLACGEVVADLLYGERRDWRGAWAASQALASHPSRDADGRLRDALRIAALEVELAASASEPRPSWDRIRAGLRRAWDLRAEDRRSRSKLELVFMQTFAWQGRWDRVEPAARAIIDRYSEEECPAEVALARIYVARSLERRGDYEQAIGILSRVLSSDIPAGKGLRMGFDSDPGDLRARANRWLQHFQDLQMSEGAGIEPANAELAADEPEA